MKITISEFRVLDCSLVSVRVHAIYYSPCLSRHAVAHMQSESVEARFVFSFMDQPELRVSMRNRGSQTFEGYSRYGFKLLTKRQVLERSRHMKDDSFTIRCVVVVRSDENTEEQGAGTIQAS
jgi:speckle-type POZ protein